MEEEKGIEVPVWVLNKIYDTLRIHRNVMIDDKNTNSCLWRQTNQAMNLVSCYRAGKVTDENIDKIARSYTSGELLDF